MGRPKKHSKSPVMFGALEKRSFRLGKLRTSVALEPAFWAFMELEALRLNVSMPKLIQAVSARRAPKQSLASALRTTALNSATGRART